MPSRLRNLRSKNNTSMNQHPPSQTTDDTTSDETSKLKPSPVLHGAMTPARSNGLPHDSVHNSHTNNLHTSNPHAATSTIRTVRSFDTSSETSSSEHPPVHHSDFTSSLNSSNINGDSSNSNSHSQQTPVPSTPRLKPRPSNSILAASHHAGSQMSSNDGGPRGGENGADDSLAAPDASLGDDHSAHEGSPQWDGAVGKAGLGKTGRVINKLVSDNEVLKRDLKIERLKAEESKQAAKLVEDKMERLISDYESRLLEANVTKTLLSRKERQVESLQGAVELEKKRTADAQDREVIWRKEMENVRRDTMSQVEDANSHAALMEGRYNAISSHWKDQGEEVRRATANLDGRIKALIEERLKDDQRINVLRDLCDQQDVNIRDLRGQRDEISQKFEAYKREQEEALRTIKENARKREEEQLRTIEETKQVLGQLKWALNVKRNVKGAE